MFGFENYRNYFGFVLRILPSPDSIFCVLVYGFEHFDVFLDFGFDSFCVFPGFDVTHHFFFPVGWGTYKFPEMVVVDNCQRCGPWWCRNR